jgi:pyruvate formate lyase activating enzyme
LETVNAFKIPFVIRAPIIPSLNDEKRHFLALKKLQDSMEYCQGVQIMPYHKIGAYKYEFLQRKYACQNIKEPSNEMIKLWRTYFE